MTKQHKNLFSTREEYNQFKQVWKTFAKTKEATAQDHMVYALLKGIPLRKAFMPVTNANKLNCNYSKYPYFNTRSTYHCLSARLAYNRIENLGFYNLVENELAKAKLQYLIKQIGLTNTSFDEFMDQKSAIVLPNDEELLAALPKIEIPKKGITATIKAVFKS